MKRLAKHFQRLLRRLRIRQASAQLTVISGGRAWAPEVADSGALRIERTSASLSVVSDGPGK